MMHQSIATIDSPEFINLQPLEINPLMSSCEIKVLYLGENRNHSYITKEVATEMAKTLRGAPIVGYYKDEKELQDSLTDYVKKPFEIDSQEQQYVSPKTIYCGIFIVMFMFLCYSFYINMILTKQILLKTNRQYTIMFEKHSSVMLNYNALNIRNNSISDSINLTQTGRDR